MKKKYEKPKIITHEVIIEDCMATASVVFNENGSAPSINTEVQQTSNKEIWGFDVE